MTYDCLLFPSSYWAVTACGALEIPCYLPSTHTPQTLLHWTCPCHQLVLVLSQTGQAPVTAFWVTQAPQVTQVPAQRTCVLRPHFAWPWLRLHSNSTAWNSVDFAIDSRGPLKSWDINLTSGAHWTDDLFAWNRQNLVQISDFSKLLTCISE